METKIRTKQIVQTALFLAIAIVAQLLGTLMGGAGSIGQILTGSIVNMCLVLAVSMIGLIPALAISVLSPVLAFVFGVMKFPFAIPVVIIGNAIYVVLIKIIFKSVSETKMPVQKIIEIIGVIVSAVVKALAMWSLAKYVLMMFTKVPAPLIASFSFPQAITGTIGGIIAIVVYAILKKTKATN